MSTPNASYAPRTDATPEAESSALAQIYRLVIDAAHKKEGSRPGAPNAAKGSKHDSRRHQDSTG